MRSLHRSRHRVILDVVYDHTAETLGPTINFRGIDSTAYYRLMDHDGYKDFTGTGNSLNARHPHTLRNDHGFAALLE